MSKTGNFTVFGNCRIIPKPPGKPPLGNSSPKTPKSHFAQDKILLQGILDALMYFFKEENINIETLEDMRDSILKDMHNRSLECYLLAYNRAFCTLCTRYHVNPHNVTGIKIHANGEWTVFNQD